MNSSTGMNGDAPSISDLVAFVAESNRIEGIRRPPLPDEIEAHDRFLSLDAVTIEDMATFVASVQPGARLRNHEGLNVRVGNHVPPAGGPGIETILNGILLLGQQSPFADPWHTHCEYETLHPFTDGNGRSGRVLWLWMMLRQGKDPYALQRGFLHTFYYQTLSTRSHGLGGHTVLTPTNGRRDTTIPPEEERLS